LVDNGSPRDDLGSTMRCVSHAFPVVANDENLGFARAVNQGIRLSDADYVCIQNNDTIMYEGGYERMIAHLEEHAPRLGLIGPMTNNADSVQRGDGNGRGVQIVNGLVAFFCTVIPRRVIDDVGLLSEEYGMGYGEDNDYCIRLRDAGYRLGIARDVFVHHDHHATYRALIGDDGIDRLGVENSERLMAKHGRLE